MGRAGRPGEQVLEGADEQGPALKCGDTCFPPRADGIKIPKNGIVTESWNPPEDSSANAALKPDRTAADPLIAYSTRTATLLLKKNVPDSESH